MTMRLQEAYEQAAGEAEDLARRLAETEAALGREATRCDQLRDQLREMEADRDRWCDRHAEAVTALHAARLVIVALYEGTAEGASPAVDLENRRAARRRALKVLMRLEDWEEAA